MILHVLSLIAALLAGNGPGKTEAQPAQSYELTVGAAYADVSVTINGFEILSGREEKGGQHVLLLNGFLKPSGNTLKVTITPAFPGQDSSGAISLVRYVSGGGGDSIVSMLDLGSLHHPLALPAEKDLTFDAPGTPELAIWRAEAATLDDTARAAIVAALRDFQSKVTAELDRHDTKALVVLFQTLSSNKDAAYFLPRNDLEHVADALVDQLAPAVNDQKGFGVARAPAFDVGELSFRQVGDHVVVARKDGAPIAGFLFKTEKGLDGLTVDRPVFGMVDGQWVQLQDLKLAR